MNNNQMESFNGNILRQREKVTRSLKKDDSAILSRLRLYHNFVRPHLGLPDNTTLGPSRRYRGRGCRQWKTLIKAAKAPPDLLSYPFPSYSATLRQVTRTYQPLSSATPIYCLISVEKSSTLACACRALRIESRQRILQVRADELSSRAGILYRNLRASFSSSPPSRSSPYSILPQAHLNISPFGSPHGQYPPFPDIR